MGKKRSSLKLPNTVWFVAHPYASPPRKDFVSNICLWNRTAPHHRKILQSFKATVVDNNSLVHNNQAITFVGEWDCCSSFTLNKNRHPFNRTHVPIYSHLDKRVCCLNTDPYVFGKEFYYVCCKLPKIFNKIRIGDIVIFGSFTMSKRKVDKMLVDTILVVGEKILASDIHSHRFSPCFEDVTLSRSMKIIKDGIIIGKMFDTTKDYQANIPFSFVPCRREGLMDKAIIDRHLKIKELKGGPFKIGQNGGHIDVADINDVFRGIVQAIQTAGFELGVKMPEPSLTSTNSIINTEGNKIFNQQKHNCHEKNTDSCGNCTPGSCC